MIGLRQMENEDSENKWRLHSRSKKEKASQGIVRHEDGAEDIVNRHK
jgi:hypothetical protein